MPESQSVIVVAGKRFGMWSFMEILDREALRLDRQIRHNYATKGEEMMIQVRERNLIMNIDRKIVVEIGKEFPQMRRFYSHEICHTWYNIVESFSAYAGYN